MHQVKGWKSIALIFMLSILGLSFVLAGCSPYPQGDGGQPVTVKPVPQRIISLAPSHTETLFALGLGDKVVGVTDFCDYPAEALGKEKVGGFADPNLEKIISLKPDLVIANNLHEQIAAELGRVGIAVVVSNPRNVAEILDSIKVIGQATGTEAAAEALIKNINQDVSAVTEKVKALDPSSKPVVYYEVWHEPLMTVGPGTVMDDLINLAGGINIGADADKEYPEYSEEVLIQKNPQVMIHSYAHGTAEADNSATIRTRRGWENLACIRNSRIYLVDPNLATRPGPRIAEGLWLFARAIHPELFAKQS